MKDTQLNFKKVNGGEIKKLANKSKLKIKICEEKA